MSVKIMHKKILMLENSKSRSLKEVRAKWNFRSTYLICTPKISLCPDFFQTFNFSLTWSEIDQWKVPAILLFYKKVNSATWKEQKN